MTESTQKGQLGRQAVVIGGSVAGIATARVLSEHFDKVLILEKDPVDEGQPGFRDSTRQDRHLHQLLKGGAQAIERMFPGVTEDFVSSGAVQMDLGMDLVWSTLGTSLPREPLNINILQQTRPQLEHLMRRRLHDSGNVEFRDQCAVLGLLTTDDHERVTGVQVMERDTNQRIEIAADLVVDTSGRGSHLSRWLKELDYVPPESLLAKTDLAYTSLLFEDPHLGSDRPWLGYYVAAVPPTSPVGGAILPQENGRWLVTLYGYDGNHSPTDLDGYMEFASKLPDKAIYEAVREAKPIGEAHVFQSAGPLRRYYEKLSRFPDGLLTLGDGMCSLDPVYGQGMSSAILSAEALGEVLTDLGEGRSNLKGLYKTFFKKIGRILDTPWTMCMGTAMVYSSDTPSAKEKRESAYLTKVSTVAKEHPDLWVQFLRVMQLVDPLESLHTPAIESLVSQANDQA